MERPSLIGVGGGAGALIGTVGAALDLNWSIPRDAEVISSVGDALSLVRVELERTLAKPSAEAVADLHREAEEAVIAAGASPATLQVESSAVPERGALRVTAFGSVALGSDATPNISHLDEGALGVVAKAALGDDAQLLMSNGYYALYGTGRGEKREFVVIDRQGTVASSARGNVIVGTGSEVAGQLSDHISKLVRHYGPIAVAPAVRVVRGTRLVDLTLFSSPDKALGAAVTECGLAGDATVAVLLSHE